MYSQFTFGNNAGKSLSERQKEILAEIIRFKKKMVFTDGQGTVQN